MASAKLRDPQGGDKGTVDLPSDWFDTKIHRHVMWQAVRNYLSNQRQGTVSVKTRSMVSGGGAKPWRQKGTGRARAGTTRTNIWRGGGRAHGPEPRSHRYELPKKVRRMALRSALTVRAKDENVTVLTDAGVSEGRTREVAQLLKALGLAGAKCLLVTDATDTLTVRAGRNLRLVNTTSASQLNCYEVLWADHLLITNSALAAMKEATE